MPCNLRLLVLRHDALVATLTIHAAAPVTRISSMRIMAKTTGINVAVCGVSTNYEFAEQ
jgi:hypothetical protein